MPVYRELIEETFLIPLVSVAPGYIYCFVNIAKWIF